MTSPRLSKAEVRALDAILELAAGPLGPAVSERQLAARLGCSKSTATWHRNRLVEKGYIRLRPRGPREAPAVRATRQRRPDAVFGACGTCGLVRPLTADGLVPAHHHGRRACPGAGCAPIRENVA